MTSFNNQIRQIVLLLIIAFLGFLIFKELYLFLPGLLGALTTYILTRDLFFTLVEKKKWKPGLTVGLFIFVFLALIAAPVYYAFVLISPRISTLFTHTDELLTGFQAMSDHIKKITGQELFNANNITAIKSGLANFIPTFLNSSANILSNILVMFFVLYFMLAHGRDMEETVRKFIPLNDDSISALATETNHMVKANAIGIPLISIIQGLAAWLGYSLFGFGDALMWGFLTGLFAFFPIIGTMMIWVPLVIYMYSQGADGNATKLLLYSLVITGNVDYLARVTLMKKIGNVHPLITVFGVIVGLQLFGFMGFIFGPLIFSYAIILVKIYTNEFAKSYN
ncbi:MAG: AI-2E family transporter [Chitinophagaceae bacterium]